MNIHGKRVVLRALELSDMPRLRDWYNDSEIVAGLGDVRFPTSTRQQEEWFARIQHDESTVRLAVADETGNCIGLTGFWNIHWRDRRAEHAVLIGDVGARGKGYGKETIATCARYAFGEMDLYRLDAAILASNQASAAVYKNRAGSGPKVACAGMRSGAASAWIGWSLACSTPTTRRGPSNSYWA